jgi:glyoxylase-like metal-dependent hydrolase (beta-lactamase superfamily II)
MTTSIRIRMYRPGFGDCFLLTFRNGSAEQHALIDFGAHMHGEIGTMDKIMDDLEKASGSNLRLIVATHAHRDHISGFGKFASRFATFQIEEVWLPWTDDPHDKQAADLKKKHLALYDALEKHIAIAFKADPDIPILKQAKTEYARL